MRKFAINRAMPLEHGHGNSQTTSLAYTDCHTAHGSASPASTFVFSSTSECPVGQAPCASIITRPRGLPCPRRACCRCRRHAGQVRGVLMPWAAERAGRRCQGQRRCHGLVDGPVHADGSACTARSAPNIIMPGFETFSITDMLYERERHGMACEFEQSLCDNFRAHIDSRRDARVALHRNDGDAAKRRVATEAPARTTRKIDRRRRIYLVADADDDSEVQICSVF